MDWVALRRLGPAVPIKPVWPFIPTFGTGPSVGSDSYFPKDCSDMKSCNNNRCFDGRNFHHVLCKPSCRPESTRNVLKLLAAAYYPVCCRPSSFCRSLRPHRLRPACLGIVVPPSRKSNCSRPGHWPRTWSTGRSATVFPSGIYAFWRINFYHQLAIGSTRPTICSLRNHSKENFPTFQLPLALFLLLLAANYVSARPENYFQFWTIAE